MINVYPFLRRIRRSQKLKSAFFPYYYFKRLLELRHIQISSDRFLSEASGIIHIGAHHAEERYIYAKLKKRVLWIEGNPDHLKTIIANLRGFVNQKVFIGLLGSKEKDKKNFYVSSNDGLSSSVYLFGEHSELWPEVHMIGKKLLPQTTLPTLLKKNKEDPSLYDTLVLDTQGSELDILKGIPNLNTWIQRIQLETADFRVYKKAPLKTRVEDHLSSIGYNLIESQIFNSNKDQTKKCMNCRYICRSYQRKN